MQTQHVRVGRQDGTVSIWDHTVKKQLWQYPKYALGVQNIAFNADGLQLEVGVMARIPHSYFLAGDVDTATVWARTRRGKVRGCGDGERGSGEPRGGQKWAEVGRGGQRGCRQKILGPDLQLKSTQADFSCSFCQSHG